MKDKRYTITKEFCGYVSAKWIVRFCGDFVSAHDNYNVAKYEMELHKLKRS